MSDRELLEDAAKAAGMNVSWDHYDPDYCAGAEGMFLNGQRSPDNSKYWNPLTNDGDALRLAVRCAQLFGFYRFLRAWLVAMATEHGDFADPLAATRRAIGRAAAELGRSKK